MSDSIEITKLEKILEQPSVRAFVLNAEINDANYEYGDVCDICRKITNTEWISLPCGGPPCSMPWSIVRREEQ